MTKDDIKKEIDRLLNYKAAGQILRLNSDTLERAYEAYVWSLCKRAVEEAGGSAVLTGRDGNMPGTIILRGAPGHMSSDKQNFCYINCRIGEREFEIHLDVQYRGNSGVLHEVDVSVYDHADAEKVRASAEHPKSSCLAVVIECKFYLDSLPGLELGRQFVGLVSDFGKMRISGFVSNRSSPNLNKFLASKGNIEPFTSLKPGNKKEEDLFVNNLAQALRKWAM